MKFPGYWVSIESDRAVLVHTIFDETDLDPATNWKEAWQNQDSEASCKGYVQLAAAMMFAARGLALAEWKSLSQFEADQIAQLESKWIGDRCESQSLSQLLGVNPGRATMQTN